MSEMIPVQGNVTAEVRADATSLVQAAADVVSSSNKGVGKILKAFFGKWIAKNERSVALIQAQTEKDCSDIRNGIKVFSRGELLDCPVPDTITGIYDVLHTLNHMSDARRLQVAIEDALRQIVAVPPDEITDESLSQTFFNRWRREAEMIDDDELRKWWAGLLKEEAIQSNRISMRTLDVVKNLSKEDCWRFASLCRGAICGELIVSYDNRPIFGSYEDVVSLQDLGLVSNLQSAAKLLPIKDSSVVIMPLYGDQFGLLIREGYLWVHTFSLTKAGCDLIKVIDDLRITVGDVKKICEFIMSHKINSCKVEIVSVDENAKLNDGRWIRGHRPACWE